MKKNEGVHHMDLGTAASIGIGLLQHRKEIGSIAMGGIKGLGSISGQGFSKIAEHFHLPKGISKQIGQAIEDNRNPENFNGVQVMASLQFFDADRNGEISKTELTQGLQQLKNSGLSNNGNATKLYQLGDIMLKNYEKVAQLDGSGTSVSYTDMGKLINQDGKIATLSTSDWNKLNA
jgi:hypothetical protein